MIDRYSVDKDHAEIRKVVERMTVLADWLKQFRPTCTVITLWHQDFQTICHNPEIAARFQISVSAATPPTWRGFTLTAAIKYGGPR